VTDAESTAEQRLEPGPRVEVRDTFEGKWHRGFVIEEQDGDGYRVRRASDDTVLPSLPARNVRKERRNSMWWI
jgi:hypothetical protein